ncbi:MAG TPA: carboxypeptidase-like regulatory domain-containing protein, partial [Blastocatellia bacterium]|nr:carboxypeptidase-like regulatory domain-containing protein [Blastocatellia bacterium]
MKKRHLISPALLLLLALVTPRGVDAQVLYGSLTGNVTDPTGAVVTGAKVEAQNIATGVSTVVNADERGAYLFSNLQAGVYKVTITVQGFKALTQDNVRVEANTTRRLDSQMQVGDVTATVQISSDTPTLQTERADVNITLPSRQVNNLPLFGSVGRNYQTLIQLIPGTSRSQGFVGNGSGEENSAAGNPQRSISYNVNGVSRLQNNTRIDGSSVIYPWLPT